MDRARCRVVLVDDHAGFLASMTAWLGHEGFEVVGTASTAAAAVRVVSEVAPDLVLLDVHLPGRSGIDAAEDLASLEQRPAVILVSSDHAVADDPRVRAAPVSGFLPKRDLTCRAIDDVLA